MVKVTSYGYCFFRVRRRCCRSYHWSKQNYISHEARYRYSDVALVETTLIVQLVPQLVIAAGANQHPEHANCLTLGLFFVIVIKTTLLNYNHLCLPAEESVNGSCCLQKKSVILEDCLLLMAMATSITDQLWIWFFAHRVTVNIIKLFVGVVVVDTVQSLHRRLRLLLYSTAPKQLK